MKRISTVLLLVVFLFPDGAIDERIRSSASDSGKGMRTNAYTRHSRRTTYRVAPVAETESWSGFHFGERWTRRARRQKRRRILSI